MDLASGILLLRDLQSDDAIRRRVAYFDLVRRESSAEAILLTYVDPVSKAHVPIGSVGYRDVVVDYITHDLLINDLDARRALLDPSTIYTWDNLPGFRASGPALDHFVPEGFANGITMSLREKGRIVGTCNLSTDKPSWSEPTAQMLTVLRPVLADMVERVRQSRSLGLTPRELEILSLVKDGLTDSQIAAELCLSPRTVSTHMENVRGKLTASTRTRAVILAMELGLI
ncbi:response regulator transcription factor [Arthrobacter globiformis]|uniref:response regulator transcription factor n=1 Tax=Arthrobacter globiformis TaxID=1665 RepID=UPI0027866AF6|nr:LuxR C-terminal-related transcriptional regulator [Arthrobacter globiformis]MDQ0864611.1 DNA-binding CsgD family transcriptional regulator [Arthrobacter globiformis]